MNIINYNVRPDFPLLNVPDERFADAVFRCDDSKGSGIGQDRPDVIFCEFGRSVGFSDIPTFRTAVTLHHVQGVVSLCARNQMSGIAALPMVASMSDHYPHGPALSVDPAIGLLVGLDMRGYEVTLDPEPAVTATGMTKPRPTFLIFTNVNVGPELRPSFLFFFFQTGSPALRRTKFGRLSPARQNEERLITGAADYGNTLNPAAPILALPAAVVRRPHSLDQLLKRVLASITDHRHPRTPDFNHASSPASGFVQHVLSAMTMNPMRRKLLDLNLAVDRPRPAGAGPVVADLRTILPVQIRRPDIELPIAPVAAQRGARLGLPLRLAVPRAVFRLRDHLWPNVHRLCAVRIGARDRDAFNSFGHSGLSKGQGRKHCRLHRERQPENYRSFTSAARNLLFVPRVTSSETSNVMAQASTTLILSYLRLYFLFGSCDNQCDIRGHGDCHNCARAS